MAETDTPPEATGEALRLIVDEFFRLQRQRVGDRELDDAKAYLAGRFPLTIETPDDIATPVLNALFYDLPLSELETFRERVNAVTPDDIQRAARAHLRPDRLSMVLVGPAPFIVSQLERFGFRNGEVVSASELDVTTADLRAPGPVGRNDGAADVGGEGRDARGLGEGEKRARSRRGRRRRPRRASRGEDDPRHGEDRDADPGGTDARDDPHVCRVPETDAR